MNHLKQLLNYKTKNINKCSIYLGELEIKNSNITLFNKNIDIEKFNYLLNLFCSKNYKNNIFKTKILNYNNHYLDKYTNIHSKQNNINHTHIDNLLYITFLETNLHITEFSCKQNYNTLEQSINKFEINNEISILFINNNSIKIEINVNHNIDNTIKILPSILNNFK